MKYDTNTVRRFSESLAAAYGNLPVALVEKDVWITYLLQEIYSLPESKFLAFKGGTCLVKAYYGYYRFSEDIDLTWTGSKIPEHEFRRKVLGSVMRELGLEWYRDDKVNDISGTQSGHVMNYFLLAPKTGGPPVKLKVTVAFNEKLAFEPKLIKLKPSLPSEQQAELNALFGKTAEEYFAPPTVLCYSLQEIACEKIRAILTRKRQLTRSRDIVDLHAISSHLGGLTEAAPPEAVKAKLASALKIPAYKKEYDRTTQNLMKHLEELVAQVKLDPVFIEKPGPAELSRFAKELNEYIARKIINTR